MYKRITVSSISPCYNTYANEMLLQNGILFNFGWFGSKKYRALYIFFKFEKRADYTCIIILQGEGGYYVK